MNLSAGILIFYSLRMDERRFGNGILSIYDRQTDDSFLGVSVRLSIPSSLRMLYSECFTFCLSTFCVFDLDVLLLDDSFFESGLSGLSLLPRIPA